MVALQMAGTSLEVTVEVRAPSQKDDPSKQREALPVPGKVCQPTIVVLL